MTLPIPRATRVLASDAAADADALLLSPEPAIVRGLATDWPLVAAGRRSAEDAAAYLEGFDAGAEVVGYTGAAAIGGRFFYDAGMTAMNFARERVDLPGYMARMLAGRGDPEAPALYIGSTDLDAYLPGFSAANALPLASATLDRHPPLASLWVGTRTIASAHWDMSNNIAVCAVGRRRFTLFPPDQIANLYPGPLEPTPGGQVVSTVDFDAPDLARHPGFADACAAAQVAELEPGDVLIYPALWWHQVEALDPFNVLVNYWWNEAAAWMDTPMTTLLHAMLSLRERPLAEKAAWRHLFDYYVFGPAERPAAHLPTPAQGPLGPLGELGARRLRAHLLARMNR